MVPVLGTVIVLLAAGLVIRLNPDMPWREFLRNPRAAVDALRADDGGGPAGVNRVDPPVERWTAEERAVRDRLLEAARAEMPADRVNLKDGRSLSGKVLEEGPDFLVFSENYRDAGSMSIRLPRSRIASVERLSGAPPDITRSDVRFHLAFPSLHFYKRPPYTIASDERFFDIERTVLHLQRLHASFLSAFGELALHSGHQSMQVLFFSKRDAFEAYRRKCAPHLAGADGFYDLRRDRLAVFNVLSGPEVAQARQALHRQAEALARAHDSPEASRQINDRRAALERQIQVAAEEETLAAIRHEAAHQLTYSLGILPADGDDIEWLSEGLAEYCRTPRFGDRNPPALELLREAAAARRLIPLSDLMRSHGKRDFLIYEHKERILLAYAESWALVHFLMEPQRQAALFAYIRGSREPATLKAFRDNSLSVLCRLLELDPASLEPAWQAHFHSL